MWILIIITCLAIVNFYKKEILNRALQGEYRNVEVNIDTYSLAQKGDTVNVGTPILIEKKIDDWRLTLVNYKNTLPDNFEPSLAQIDGSKQFDSRAVNELNQMLKDMKGDGISNVWVQSAYRSVEYQTGLFNNKINTYMKQGKSREEAEKMTLKTINRPGTSEHNLGLAVDFNYVDYSFDTTDAFKWLQKNAENYGFILRYKEEKEDITKVDYEPWHWRFVGVEHAKKMNELNMCLEEYIEYLKKN